MAWIYLAEEGGKLSPWHRGSERSPIARATSPRKPSYLNANKKERSTLRQSGTTYEPSSADTSEYPWTQSTEELLARTSRLAELEKAWTASDPALYSKSSGLLASFDPESFSWKTAQISLWQGLTAYSWNSMRWGMMRDGLLFQPKRWAPRTSGSGSGSLPTPTAQSYGTNQTDSPQAKVRPSLAQLARKNLPTPMVSRCSYQSQKDGSQTPMLAKLVHALAQEITKAGGLNHWKRSRLPTPLATDGEKGGPNQRHTNGSLQMPALAARLSTPCARDGKDGLTPKPHGRPLALGGGGGGGGGGGSWPSWLPEPCVGRDHHGLPSRMDRLKVLGNAWVPQQAREAFERLMGLK